MPATPGGMAGGQGAAGRKALDSYSQFTQLAVKSWERLLAPRHLGSTPVPWVVIWGVATGLLMALEKAYGGGGIGLAGLILTGTLARTFMERGK